MNIVRVPINSSPSKADHRPWFAFSLLGGNVELASANAQGRDLMVNGARSTPAALRAVAVAAGEPSVLLVTLDEQLQVVPQSKQPAECLAHLGWYVPETDTLTLLQFHDDGGAPVQEVQS